MSKSHVTLETHICPVCGKEAETGALLLDTRMRQRFEMLTATGWGLCPEHQKLHEDGFIALVEARPRVPIGPGGKLLPENAIRTGLICHLKRPAFIELFGLAMPAELPMVFVEPGVVEQINARVQQVADRQANQKLIDETRAEEREHEKKCS